MHAYVWIYTHIAMILAIGHAPKTNEHGDKSVLLSHHTITGSSHWHNLLSIRLNRIVKV